MSNRQQTLPLGPRIFQFNLQHQVIRALQIGHERIIEAAQS